MFLAGIWYSVKKPPTHACLTPIFDKLQDLAMNSTKYACNMILLQLFPANMQLNLHTVVTGVKVTVRGEEVICKARLLFTLADLPAKASLTNMIQFNGKYGCPMCEHEGKQVACGKAKYQP